MCWASDALVVFTEQSGVVDQLRRRPPRGSRTAANVDVFGLKDLSVVTNDLVIPAN